MAGVALVEKEEALGMADEAQSSTLSHATGTTTWLVVVLYSQLNMYKLLEVLI